MGYFPKPHKLNQYYIFGLVIVFKWGFVLQSPLKTMTGG